MSFDVVGVIFMFIGIFFFELFIVLIVVLIINGEIGFGVILGSL